MRTARLTHVPHHSSFQNVETTFQSVITLTRLHVVVFQLRGQFRNLTLECSHATVDSSALRLRLRGQSVGREKVCDLRIPIGPRLR